MENNIISRRLRQARKRLGYSIEQLARITRISHTTIENWETGRTYPNLYNLVPVADVLKVSLDWIAGRESKNDQN